MNGTDCYMIYKPGVEPGVVELFDITPPEDWTIKAGSKARSYLDIDHMTATVKRIAPWSSTVYLIPRLFGDTEIEVAGCCSRSEQRIFVTYDNKTFSGVMSTLYHELFHSVQSRLIPAWRDNFYQEVRKRAWYYDDEAYLDRGEEKTARLFEHFAMALDSGWPHRIGGQRRRRDDDEITTDEIRDFLWDVYSGAWSKAATEKWAAEDARQAKKEKRARLLSAARSLVFG